MKERPILFSGAMVRALLDGSKTQTRRVCKSQPYTNGHGWNGSDIMCHNDYLPPSAMLMDYRDGGATYTASNMEGWDFCCPYGQPGDRLWVREAHAPRYFDDGKAGYRADWDGRAADCVPEPRWTPSIHMRRSDSRILLEIVSVRVERLNDCSEADAKAEGCRASGWMPSYSNPDNAGCDESKSAVDEYADLWESINGAGSWAANPWVWVVEFKRVMP